MKKRILSLLLALVTVLSLCSPAFAEEPEITEDVIATADEAEPVFAEDEEPFIAEAVTLSEVASEEPTAAEAEPAPEVEPAEDVPSPAADEPAEEEPAEDAPAAEEPSNLASPKISEVTNTAAGVKITWGAVSGAAQYRVFYKTTGGWVNLTDTTATSYTWAGAQSGTTYTFTVRCLSTDGNRFTSEYDRAGKTITYIAAPVLTGASSVADGVKITWSKVTGAAKYRVFYKTTDGWIKLTDTTATSYTWTGAQAGTSYTFTVRCISADGKRYTSAFDAAGRTVTYVDMPVLSGVSNTAQGIAITWRAAAGAEQYRVFYKATGKWVKLTDTTATSYTWAEAQPGTTYTFTVRCLSADGKNYTSAYDTKGKTITYIPAPVLTDVSNAVAGVKISWEKSTGAAQYRVFYKTTGGWKKLIDTSATSYTWTAAQSGTTYTFTVRCISADGKSYTSAYDTVGKTVTYVAAPVISAVVKNTSGVQIKWNKVTGAAQYRVFYKTPGNGWTALTDTAATSYTWTNAKDGTSYTFAVRCVSADGTSYTSAYDTKGTTFTPVAQPKLSKVTGDPYTGVTVTWKAVPGATGYRVFYKTTGGWKIAGDTDQTSYSWTGAVSGTEYAFTVRCIDKNGNYTSTYDTVGKSYYYIIEVPNLDILHYIFQNPRTCTATSVAMSLNMLIGEDRYKTADVVDYRDGISFCNFDTIKGFNGNRFTTNGVTYAGYVGNAYTLGSLKQVLNSKLKAGIPVVMLVDGPYVPVQHWIVIVGINGNDYNIMDPSGGTHGNLMREEMRTLTNRYYTLGNWDHGGYRYITYVRV